MSVSWMFSASSEDATAQLGAALADVLTAGTTVALIGTLGAGKTRLVRAVAEAAGVERGQVNSPTFVLVQEYEGKWPIYHFDTYRLHRDLDEFLALGAEEYLASDGVCFVEWADRVAEILPQDRLNVEIRVTGETARDFVFTATGPRCEAMLERLAAR
jgi:tRNA threonylcarbamoyladenosine biosynthesis protein TsaE